MAKRMGWIAVLVLVFLAAFAMNCGVMAEGDSGIRVSVPYQYIVPQNPGENSGLTFSIQIPEEITDDQIQLQSVMARTYENNEQHAFAIQSLGNHTYMIPDSDLAGFWQCDIDISITCTGYNPFRFYQSIPLLDAVGSNITLSLKDGDNPVSANTTFATGKEYTLHAESTDSSIAGMLIWTGREWTWISGSNGETGVFFPQTGTYTLSAYEMTDNYGTRGKKGTPITVSAASTKGPLGQPVVSVSQQEFEQGDGIPVTVTQPMGTESVYLKLITADHYKNEWASVRRPADESGTLEYVFPSSWIETNDYIIQAECYADGYEASTAYSPVFHVNGGTNTSMGTIPAPFFSTNVESGSIVRGEPIQIEIISVPPVENIETQPEIKDYTATLYKYSEGSVYPSYVASWGTRAAYSKRFIIATDNLDEGATYRLSVTAEADGWDSNSGNYDFTITAPETEPAGFRMTKTPKIYESVGIILHEAGAKFLEVTVSWTENGNQRSSVLRHPGDTGAWIWTPQAVSTYTLTPHAYSDEECANEIANINAQPITVTTTSEGTMPRVTVAEAIPTELEPGEDLSFAFGAVNGAYQYQVSMTYRGATGSSTWDSVWSKNYDQTDGVTQFDITIPGTLLTREGIYTLSVTAFGVGYTPGYSSYQIEVSDSRTWKWRIEGGDSQDENNTLILSGTGEISDFAAPEKAPWWKNAASSASKVNRIIIEEGITSLGKNVLAGFDGTVRIDFMQSTRPAMDEDVFGNTTAVCRFFDNTTAPGSWTGGFGGQATWIYLPFQPTTSIQLSYSKDSVTGTYRWIAEETSGGHKAAVTAAEAREMTFERRWIYLDIIPTAESGDRAVYESMDVPTRIQFYGMCSGEYVLTTTGIGLEEIDCMGSSLQLTVNMPAGHKLKKLTVREGSSITYNGDIQTLRLTNTFSSSPAVTVNGNIDEAHFYQEESGIMKFWGSMNLNGTIGQLTVYGGNGVYVPGISKTENDRISIGSMASRIYHDILRTGEAIIIYDEQNQRSILNLTESGTEINGLDYRQFTYEYFFKENGVVQFSMQPKPDSGLNVESAFISNIRDEKYNPDFGPGDMIRGNDTVVYIQHTGTDPDDLIILNAGEDGSGYDRIYLEDCRVEVKCPVTGTVGVWQYAFDQGPVYATINNTVRQLVLVLNRSGGEVYLGESGTIEGGYWTRGVRGLRHFSTLRGTQMLAEDGRLNIFSADEGNSIRNLPAKDSVVTAAAGDQVSTGQIASMEIKDGKLNDAEQIALDRFLAQNTGLEAIDNGVVDITVSTYSFTDGGANVAKGKELTELGSAVPVQIANDTGKTIGIVRLHEDNGNVTAAQMQMTPAEGEEPVTMTDGGVFAFNSALFSKYVLVTNGEAAGPQECGNGVTWALTDGALEIRKTGDGDGAMTSHPWTAWATEITSAVIGEGVTSICEEAFAGCSNMTGISIPSTITEIPGAFAGCNALNRIYYGGLQEDWYAMLNNIREITDGLIPLSRVTRENTSFRPTADISTAGMPDYHFSFTFTEPDEDGTALATDEDEDGNTRVRFDNNQIVVFGFNAPEIQGYTKSYRLAIRSEQLSRVMPNTDGTGRFEKLLKVSREEIQYNPTCQGYAVYIPQNETAPMLIARSNTIQFLVKPMQTMQGNITLPKVYALGTAGGLNVTFTLPEGVTPDMVTNWTIRVENSENFFSYSDTMSTSSVILTEGTNHIPIPENTLEGGRKYLVLFTISVRGFDLSGIYDEIMILNEGEDPEKLLDAPTVSVDKHYYNRGEKVRLTLRKVAIATDYTITLYDKTSNIVRYSTAVAASDFGENETLMVSLPTDELAALANYTAEAVCSADGYVSNSHSASFILYAEQIPELVVSSPESYTKKRNPAPEDGLAVTLSPSVNMKANGAEAVEWTLNVYDGNGAPVCALTENNSVFYGGSLIIPDECLEAGESYTYTLDIRYMGYTSYSGGAHSFSVLEEAADSLEYEVSTYSTHVGDRKALYIKANGAIPDYTETNPAPWAGSGAEVSLIVLEGDITSIGANAFKDFTRNDLRIEFNQNSMPTISATAFSGCTNVVCRYYANNGTWNGGKYGTENVTWIYLPVKVGTSSYGNLEFDYNQGGWSFMQFNDATSTNDLYPVTVAQANELAHEQSKILYFDAIPDNAADQAFYRGWERVENIYVKCEGTLNVDLPAGNDLYNVRVENSGATVNITNPEKLIGGLYCSGGQVTYTGDIASLTLAESYSNNDQVTVAGNIDLLNFYGPEANSSYRGSMYLTGTVTNGTVLGRGGANIKIPGVDPTTSDRFALKTFENVTMTNNGTLIDHGVLQIGTGDQAVVSLDMYRLEYTVWDVGGAREIFLILTPKPEVQNQIGNESIWFENLNITTDEFVYGPDTYVSIQTSPSGETVVLNGKRGSDGTVTGVQEIYFNNGALTLNCPASCININNEKNSSGGIRLTINSTVGSLYMHDPSSGFVTLGEGGRIAHGGTWLRAYQANRYFEEVSGPATVYASGSLWVMSRRSGEELAAMMPTADDLAIAAGTSASAEVEESSESALTLDESDALAEFLVTHGGTVAAVFDATITTDAGGKISSLSEPVEFAVSNEAEGEAFVLRLHEETDDQGKTEVKATPVSAATDAAVIPFESDLFSKYVIVATGAINPDKLNTLVLPADLTRIEANAFEGGAFQAVIIPDSCTEVEAGAFKDCKNLVYVSYKNGTVFGNGAFDGCEKLTENGRIERN